MRYFEPIYYTAVETVFTDTMEKLTAAPVDPTLTAVRRKPWEVEDIVASPTSDYHKILDGYPYNIYLEAIVLTGAPGARHLYKAMLQDGMTEEQIGTVMHVILGEQEYPLNALKIVNR